jgi:hypothetical protein
MRCDRGGAGGCSGCVQLLCIGLGAAMGVGVAGGVCGVAVCDLRLPFLGAGEWLC